ncbi:MAG: efflux RND transporter permease subunit [Flavobacteriales bacterium]
MGDKLAHFILSFRIPILVFLALLTAFFGYNATKVELDYEMPKLLPQNHPDYIAYEDFKEMFGNDGFNILIGIEDKDFYTVETFNKWKQLGEEVSKVEGIDSSFSEANFYTIEKPDSTQAFSIVPISPNLVERKSELDSIKDKIRSLPFYRGTVFNDSKDFHAMMLMVNPDFFNSKERGKFVNQIKEIGDKYEASFNGKLFYTGLPFIRATNMLKISSELTKFMILSLLATVLVLFFFFRSLRVVVISVVIVMVGVAWTMGIVGICGYKLTVIMGLLPPLIIVIGIPNCVYLINKYQQLYLDSKDQEYALRNVITKIGNITFLTNVTTAFGFGTFIFTNSLLLFEFGVVAFFSIILLFLLTILLIPILFSFLAPPKSRHIKHLEKNWIAKFLTLLRHTVRHKKPWVFGLSAVVVLFCVFGISFLKPSGKMVDDLPNGDKVKTDLVVFQENLAGTMPFEVVLDVKSKRNRFRKNILKKIDSVQRYLESYDEISRTTSLVDALKFVNQSVIYDGDPIDYQIPETRYLRKISRKLEDDSITTVGISINMFIDSSGTKSRITSQIEDMGVDKLDSLIEEVKPKIDEILNPDKIQIYSYLNQIKDGNKERKLEYMDSLFYEFPYIEFSYLAYLRTENLELYEKYNEEGLNFQEILSSDMKGLNQAVENTLIGNKVTGFTVPFAKGTKYLIINLLISLLFAIMGIAILMAFLFRSFWIVLISIITNVIPLLFTAGLMGYFGVDLKPSTILVFSISLGIAVDDAIHFLAKFKQELKLNNGDLSRSVYAALKETGISMFYTSIILFFGFSIFIASSYGGTQALGILVSITLLVAMLCNLVLLPSLLLRFKNLIER